MRISDWSSDVCSSDLSSALRLAHPGLPAAAAELAPVLTVWSHAALPRPRSIALRRAKRRARASKQARIRVDGLYVQGIPASLPPVPGRLHPVAGTRPVDAAPLRPLRVLRVRRGPPPGPAGRHQRLHISRLAFARPDTTGDG